MINHYLTLQHYNQQLTTAGITSPAHEIAKIICHIKKIDHAFYHHDLIKTLSTTDWQTLATFIQARLQRKPLERILGTTTIYDLAIDVSPDVFKPYPETTAFIEQAHILLADKTAQSHRILDLGTGTGCILLALLQVLPNATGIGVDINPHAITTAQHNALKHNLQNRAHFCLSNWGEDMTEQFDCVLSHPPRVATKDIKRLLPEMRDYDPAIALDGGKDGLDFYRRSAQTLARLTKPNGFGLFQVGTKYARQAEKIFHHAGFYNTTIKTNYRGLPIAIAVANQRRIQPTLRFYRRNF
jgi:release factor glutamine methyltransferase